MEDAQPPPGPQRPTRIPTPPSFNRAHNASSALLPYDAIVVSSRSSKILRFSLGHKEAQSHGIKVWGYEHSSIPVLIGASVPRRDSSDTYTQFCRLMLIFFKPWRRPANLLHPALLWDDAYNMMITSDMFLHRHFEAINNIQLLHECKDSRDRDYEC